VVSFAASPFHAYERNRLNHDVADLKARLLGFGQLRHVFLDARIRATLAQRGQLGRVNQGRDLLGVSGRFASASTKHPRQKQQWNPHFLHRENLAKRPRQGG